MVLMSSRQERGAALITVLWFVAALTVLVAGMVYGSRVDIKLVGQQRNEAEVAALADGAIRLAAAELAALPAQERNRMFRRSYPIGGRQVEVTAVPAAGLIDLNQAPLPLLQGALQYGAELAPADAAVLAARIVDWRDPDQVPQDGGAEAADYRAAGRSGPRNSPFVVVSDLRQVLGVGPDLFARLRHMLTVDGAATVDPNVAPPEVLLALAQGNVAVVQQALEQRARGVVVEPGLFPQGRAGRGGGSMFRMDGVVVDGDDRAWLRDVWVRIDVTGVSGRGGNPWLWVSSDPVERR